MTREEKLERLRKATELVSDQTYDDIAHQSKIVAANLFVGVGDKALLTASGFVYAVESVHEAALAWLLSEGYVTLTEKATATEDELAKRRAKKAAQADAPLEQRDRAIDGYF